MECCPEVFILVKTSLENAVKFVNNGIEIIEVELEINFKKTQSILQKTSMDTREISFLH